MAVIGQDPIPTAYDAINGGGCDFPIAVHAVRIELTSGDTSWTADTQLPEPARNIGIPFNDLDVPVINADLPDGRYARRVAALAWVRNSEVEMEVPGFEDVYLVRDIDSQQAHLFRNHGIWERRGLINYDYTGAWVCVTCDEFYVATAAVSVRDGAVTSVSSADPNIAVIPVPERFIPIAGLFDAPADSRRRGRAQHRRQLQRRVLLPHPSSSSTTTTRSRTRSAASPCAASSPARVGWGCVIPSPLRGEG